MRRLRLTAFLLLLLGLTFASSAQDACPRPRDMEEIESGDEISEELDDGDSLWYSLESDVNVVWRVDMEADDTLTLNFYGPDFNGDIYFDFAREADELSTAFRTVYAGDRCVEVFNDSGDTVEFELTITELEMRGGELENTDGLDSYGNNVVGVFYHNMGEFETALEFYELALDENQSDPRFWDNACLAHRDLVEYEEALDLCLGAVDIEPSNAYYNFDTGIIYQALGEYEDAQAYFEEAIDIDPNDFNFRFSLGMNHVFLGNGDEAIEAFDEYVDLSDLWFRTFWRGLAYLSIGDLDNGIDDIEEAIDTDENEPALYHFWLGVAYLADGDEDEAEDEFDTAQDILDNTSDELTILRSNALFAVIQGENDDAEDFYSDAIERGSFFSHRADLYYLTALVGLFPEEDGYADALQWLQEELGVD